ncbi:Muramoyltetrapeptide carboxypeptidase LdcA (peptidoglycan recycling) [Fictibacillus solisalsi]|uniref:Muramoyltetrapeptide carboxypeptidase LdcA (Peptidoglycan recycling) n=1 Tax=Fictibacillus solisalsi TaxID=459525 RepID=A0A1G9TMG7_9BACL|nr:S66 peptidase family protein [Fictibacillus solisalsi]SDM48937.1 Muramoyltetrapeptide carboxypeptidase LdcA (peptidoglycan recycling) [Fictibacillus solisalsi]
MIIYPSLEKGATIGVTAPSSGLSSELHPLLKQAIERMEKAGYKVVCGETPWTQSKAKSADATLRAAEFNDMMKRQDIDLVFPPWGGELLIEMLPFVEYSIQKPKWILGYSDISVLLLAVTLTTGIATAHGTNLIDLRGEETEATTAMWETILSASEGDSVLQHSSEKYQEKWDHENPSPHVYHLTERTEWKTVSRQAEQIKGRLLGGCIDVIRHLIGTPFGNVASFKEEHIPGEPVIWYLENCELNTADLRRSLVQMKMAGWFNGCSGILFGRSAANEPVGGYTVEDVYHDLAKELQIPVIYDIDCGHVPPQVTLINGAWAEVGVVEGRGTILQHFKR